MQLLEVFCQTQFQKVSLCDKNLTYCHSKLPVCWRKLSSRVSCAIYPPSRCRRKSTNKALRSHICPTFHLVFCLFTFRFPASWDEAKKSFNPVKVDSYKFNCFPLFAAFRHEVVCHSWSFFLPPAKLVEMYTHTLRDTSKRLHVWKQNICFRRLPFFCKSQGGGFLFTIYGCLHGNEAYESLSHVTGKVGQLRSWIVY